MPSSIQPRILPRLRSSHDWPQETILLTISKYVKSANVIYFGAPTAKEEFVSLERGGTCDEELNGSHVRIEASEQAQHAWSVYGTWLSFLLAGQHPVIDILVSMSQLQKLTVCKYLSRGAPP